MKTIKLLLALCIGFSYSLTSTIKASALDLTSKSAEELENIEEIVDQELSIAIISGDGSAENPYVVDYSLAPTFKQYMEEISENVMTSMSVSSDYNEISPYGIYDGILQGTAYYNQTYGGEWEYKPNSNYADPTTIQNGNIWMRKIIYVTPSETSAIADEYTDKVRTQLQKYGGDLVGKPFNQIKDELLEAGFTIFGAKALWTAIGHRDLLFTAAEGMRFVIDFVTRNKYRNAANSGYGMINATFLTSYNGSWYSNYGEDSWTTPNTVYLPSTVYGYGQYQSYTSW